MAKYRDRVDEFEIATLDKDGEIVSQDLMYPNDVYSALDDIESRVNDIIDKFKIDSLQDCLDELKKLSEDLY